jgi:integrase
MAKSISFTVERLTKLKCDPTKQQEIYWDIKNPGYFGVRVTKNQAKAYVFQNRLHGQTVRITIGDLNSWTIAQAQNEARRLKVLTDQGVDPRDEKKLQKAQAIAKKVKGTLGLVIWNEYVAERKTHWGDRHLADHNDMVRVGGEPITRGLKSGQSKRKEQGILYGLLSNPLDSINREVVLKWLRFEITKRPARARLALSALKAFLTWAGDQPKYSALLHANACDRLSRELPRKQAKDDCLQKEQLKVWFEGVKRIRNPVISAYLQALLLTGARRNELAELRWVDIDTQWHTATIKDKVEGSRQIPLTPYVENLIKMLPRTNAYVFSSSSSDSGRIMEPRKAHQQVITSSGLPQLSLHGLRRSFGTLAEWVECPAGIAAQIMGHKPSAIAEKHYRRRPIDLLRQWHTKIEGFILQEAGISQPAFEDSNLRLVKG